MGDTSDHSGQLPPDDALIAALKAGDEKAFAQLLDAWSPGMLRTARSHVHSDQSAEDVVQDTWLALLRGIDGFEGRSSLRTWTYRILINIAKTRGAREHRVVPVLELTPEDYGPTVDPGRFRGPDDQYPGGWKSLPAAWPSPETELVSREVRQQVDRALADLPHRQRIVITLRDVEGYTSDEVCGLLDITPANQRVLLHRARAAVRAQLEDYYTGSAMTEGVTR